MLIEIAIQSTRDALAAERAGADRLELCAALALGGLTPSLGLLREVKQSVGLPVMALIRPRAGHFRYGDAELRIMAADIETAVAAGADGLVFGVLGEDGAVDGTACRDLLARCGGRQSVFHRAFDLTPDPRAALEALIELGFTRVLTSGQAACVTPPSEGAAVVRRLIEQAAGRIEILPAGGIRARNLVALVEATGCDQVHAGCRGFFRLDASTATSLGFGVDGDDSAYEATDEIGVASLRSAADGLRS